MKYRLGQKLVRCLIDGDTLRPSYDVYMVRSIRGGKVYAVLVNEFTWVKLAWGRDQSRGWARVIDPVFRLSCREGCRFDYLHTTKCAALRQARKWHALTIERQSMHPEVLR